MILFKSCANILLAFCFILFVFLIGYELNSVVMSFLGEINTRDLALLKNIRFTAQISLIFLILFFVIRALEFSNFIVSVVGKKVLKIKNN